MGRGLGQLQKRLLSEHQAWWDDLMEKKAQGLRVNPAAEQTWGAGDAMMIGRRIYGEPTESQLRSIRRAAKRLIEDGLLVKDTRAAEIVKVESEGRAKQREIIRETLRVMCEEQPGRMFDASGIARRASKLHPGWFEIRKPSRDSTATLTAAGLLRAMRKRGEVNRERVEESGNLQAYYYLDGE